VPAIEWFTWPDQWYHADTDTPDKSDPTQLKRVAFLGAAAAWAAANCTDEVLEGLLEWVSAFGYRRIGQRELPRAFRYLDTSDAENFQDAVDKAFNLCAFVVERESRAVRTVREIYSGSERAEELVSNQVRQWQFYLEGLHDQILKYAEVRAAQLEVEPPRRPSLSKAEMEYARVIPSIHADVMEKEFNLESSDRYTDYLEKNPDALKEIDLDRGQRRAILNFIDGERSVTKIRSSVIAETDQDLDLETLSGYLGFLRTIGWIGY
jgi:hypothetical protein